MLGLGLDLVLPGLTLALAFYDIGIYHCILSIYLVTFETFVVYQI